MDYQTGTHATQGIDRPRNNSDENIKPQSSWLQNNSSSKLSVGMFVYALAFLLGVVLVHQLDTLPSITTPFIITACLVVLLIIISYLDVIAKQSIPTQFASRLLTLKRQTALTITLLLLIILGIIYTIEFVRPQLLNRLDEQLMGKNLILQGEVSGLPIGDKNVQRFDFTVERYLQSRDNPIDKANGDAIQPDKINRLPRKVRLSWYHGEPVHTGEQWQFEVRLKPPHGFMNPGGFDYEAWLFQQGIQATGYVRQSGLNQLLQSSSNVSFLSYTAVIRQRISQMIGQIALTEDSDNRQSFALIKALAMGDKSGITPAQWQTLSATGTSHLMAISGLHIGLAALFAYIVIRRLVPVFIIKLIPAQHVAILGGVFIACIYALIAGLSIPTQRAFIMLFVLSMMLLLRRNHRPLDALGLALLLVLVIDPIAVLSVGFWFSFSAVAVIFISIRDYETELPVARSQHSLSSGWQTAVHKFFQVVIKWIRLQCLISLFLLPLSLYMFQQASLISPLANLILIPYVSFLVVPVILIAIGMSFISPTISSYLFQMSAYSLDIIWPMLKALADLPHSIWVQGDVGITRLLLASTIILVIYYSKSMVNMIGGRHSVTLISQKYSTRNLWLLRLLLLILFLSVLWPWSNSSLTTGEYKVTVLDVGQGSAAVVRTQNHTLIFDSGARFSERFDIGSSVIIPFLRSQGLNTIDRLVISHGDADHIGGAQAIISAYPDVLVLGQDIERLKTDSKQVCQAGQHWQWDGVDFTFLSPLATNEAAETVKHEVISDATPKRNNRSCVLKIASQAGSILFTGDIEKTIEQQLLIHSLVQLESTVLIVPHHGSKSSSSQAFIDAVDPAAAIISTGYHNRYRLPNSQVISRYKISDVSIYRTDIDGAVDIQFLHHQTPTIDTYRSKAKKYWHHAPVVL